MVRSESLRSGARPLLVAALCLGEIVWFALAEWPMQALDVITHSLVLGLGAAGTVIPRNRWLRSLGMGLLLLELSIVGIMTAVLGSVTPYGKTGVETFGVFGFAVAAAFVAGYWANHWLERFSERQRPKPLSARAQLVVLCVLCSLSIGGAVGELLLTVSYPDGLIPSYTWWGRAMVWVMMVSVPAVLIGSGMLLFAAPVGVHLVRVNGISSWAGRAAVAIGLAALVSAAITLNR